MKEETKTNASAINLSQVQLQDPSRQSKCKSRKTGISTIAQISFFWG